jgi:hypothetical protein
MGIVASLACIKTDVNVRFISQLPHSKGKAKAKALSASPVAAS